MFDYIKDILSFDTELFHFLRPDWLWAFIPVVLISILVLVSSQENQKWKNVISPALRPYMFTKEKRSAVFSPLLSFILITTLGVLGLAGPTWSKVEVPGAKSEAVLMIAMDASLSMMAEDIQPNRLERAKFKIRDLLEANPGSRVSLYAYSGTAHTVVPMCSDYRLVEHHLESIYPGIMPVQGTKLEMMLSIADTTLRSVKAPSTLLIVTDAIEDHHITHLKSFVDNSPHSIEILAMATPQGAQIPKDKWKNPVKDSQGNVVISKLNSEVLFELQQHKKINVNTLTLDNSDMEKLALHIRKNLNYQEDADQSDEEWKDMGYISVIILVLLIPLWFRKGWMIQYAWLPFLFIIFPSCDEKKSWKDLWYSKDYQGQTLYDNNAFEEAGETYESSFHQGVAYYKAGNYDAAAQSFAKDSMANSLFNLGLSYTQMGLYDEALEAIELAATKDPSNKDFQNAITETNKTIGIIDSMKAAGTPLIIPEKPEEEKQKLEERKAKGKDEELSADNEVEELPEDGKRVTDEVETDTRKGEELEEVPDDFQAGTGDSPQNILLREISSDPAEFLRRRFKYQNKKYHHDLIAPTEKY